MKVDSARKWHGQLGLLNQADVVRNAPETMGELDDVCNVCAFAKITKTPVPRAAETRAEEKLERVFTDVMGTLRVESLSGFRFFIVFADQYTKFVVVDLLQAKKMKQWPACSHCGDAKEAETRQCEGIFLRAIQNVLLEASILQEKTNAETPQQNALAEKCNRTLLEMARCLLIDSRFPKMMCGAAILHATRIRNLVVIREENGQQS